VKRLEQVGERLFIPGLRPPGSGDDLRVRSSTS